MIVERNGALKELVSILYSEEGWRPNSFIPGDMIEISFNPMLDGSNAGAFIGAKFQDGKTLGKWD